MASRGGASSQSPATPASEPVPPARAAFLAGEAYVRDKAFEKGFAEGWEAGWTAVMAGAGAGPAADGGEEEDEVEEPSAADGRLEMDAAWAARFARTSRARERERARGGAAAPDGTVDLGGAATATHEERMRRMYGVQTDEIMDALVALEVRFSEAQDEAEAPLWPVVGIRDLFGDRE